jgi:hypothetical protein
MPRWIVDCPHCKKAFIHTEIAAIVTRLARDSLPRLLNRKFQKGNSANMPAL